MKRVKPLKLAKRIVQALESDELLGALSEQMIREAGQDGDDYTAEYLDQAAKGRRVFLVAKTIRENLE